MSIETKTLDNILYKELRPWLDQHTLDQKFASKLSTIKNFESDFHFKYEIAFLRPTDHKTKYYNKLILNNVKEEIDRLISLIQEDDNDKLVKYYVNDILNKRIKTRLKDIGKLIKEKDFDLTYIDPNKANFELDQAHKANTFIVQLLKLSYMQLYLEIQEAFISYIDDKLIIQDFYTQLLFEPLPKETFITEVQTIEIEERPIQKSKSQQSKTSSTVQSFRYKQMNTDPDKLTNTWDSLKLNNLISKHTTQNNFKKVFTGGEVKTPIQWTGNISELFYFIKLIYVDKKLVEELKQKQWEVTCHCFVDAEGNPFERSKFRSLKRPNLTGNTIEKIVEHLI